MDMIYFLAALAGFLLVMGSWTQYLLTIPKGTVPEWPVGAIVIQALGIVAAVVGILTLSFDRPVLATISAILAVVTISMAAFFYWLLFTQRQTPIGDIQVQVGDKLLPFSALTPEGTRFHSDELLGKRTLFKFFRGGW